MALSYAAEGGDVEVVAKLVELGLEVDGADKVRVRISFQVRVRVRFIIICHDLVHHVT